VRNLLVRAGRRHVDLGFRRCQTERHPRTAAITTSPTVNGQTMEGEDDANAQAKRSGKIQPITKVATTNKTINAATRIQNQGGIARSFLPMPITPLNGR